MLDSPASRLLRFDAFTVDLTRCVLLHGGAELPLRRQSFDVLRTLAERRGGVVSKDDLLKAVWPGVKVTDDSIIQCVKEIRRALGEEARWIVRTVPGRGYQFVAAVTVIEEAAPASPASPEPGPPAQVSQEIRPRGSASVPASRSAEHRLFIVAGLSITVLVAAGWLIWQRFQPEPPAVLTVMAMPTIAVLPFATAEDDPALSSEARVFADEILHDVARGTIGSLNTLKLGRGLPQQDDRCQGHRPRTGRPLSAARQSAAER